MPSDGNALRLAIDSAKENNKAMKEIVSKLVSTLVNIVCEKVKP